MHVPEAHAPRHSRDSRDSRESRLPAEPSLRSRRRGDGGQAAVLVVCVTAVLVVAIVVALAALGRTSVDRTRAQTAADAAALASVTGGSAAARSLAAAHGATLTSWQPGPGRDQVTVVVRLGDVTATARATDAP